MEYTMSKPKLIVMLITSAILLSITPAVIADTDSGEEINWQVISSGGQIDGTSTNYILSGTVAQTAVGAGGSTNYGLSHGFWQDPSGGSSCCILPGDVNHNSAINILDITYLINFLYKGGPVPKC